MSEYTTEDFGKARFAESPEGRVAMRHSGRWSLESKFTAATMTGLSDEDMAVAGWRPVHEHNPHATDALEEEIQDLRDANAGLKTRVEYLDGELVLWQERLWQERASQAEAHERQRDHFRSVARAALEEALGIEGGE